MTALIALVPPVPAAMACRALGVSRATFHRRRATSIPRRPEGWPPPPRALRPEERARVLERPHSKRFVDRAPAKVAATLLDEKGVPLLPWISLAARCGADVLRAAYAAHPDRFVRRPPTVAGLPPAVWINPPAENQAPGGPRIDDRDPTRDSATPADTGRVAISASHSEVRAMT